MFTLDGGLGRWCCSTALTPLPLRQSMFAVGWLELKELQRAWSQLEKCFSNITEPFKVSGGAADPSCSQAGVNGIETHRTAWSIPNQLLHHLFVLLVRSGWRTLMGQEL